MTNAPQKSPPTPEQITRLLGPLEAPKLTEIVALSPQLLDIEEAAMCLAGSHDVLAKSAHHVSATAERIVEILLSDAENAR